MKIKGEFILRQIAGDNILVPVGETALASNGLITLDPVGLEIWQGAEQGLGRGEILQRVLDRFDVDAKTAEEDMNAFLEQLRAAGLLEE